MHRRSLLSAALLNDAAGRSMEHPDANRSPTLVIPAGVAAVQARISSIESRFAPSDRPQRAQSIDFDRMLSAVQSERGSERIGGTADPHHVHDDDRTAGPAGPPPELAPHGNGEIPPAALEPIGQGNHRMWEPAARAFRDMAAAASRDGIVIPVTDSYRSLEEQLALADRKGIYGQGGLAAVPGTSNHGWGRSLDVDTGGGTVEWLRANADRFGFHEDVPGEPWHWTYRP